MSATKKEVDRKGRVFNKEWTAKYAFTEFRLIAVYLPCHESVAIFKNIISAATLVRSIRIVSASVKMWKQETTAERLETRLLCALCGRLYRMFSPTKRDSWLAMWHVHGSQSLQIHARFILQVYFKQLVCSVVHTSHTEVQQVTKWPAQRILLSVFWFRKKWRATSAGGWPVPCHFEASNTNMSCNWKLYSVWKEKFSSSKLHDFYASLNKNSISKPLEVGTDTRIA